jgi:hypothetical protein
VILQVAEELIAKLFMLRSVGLLGHSRCRGKGRATR